MPFRENLLSKIEIDQLADMVARSIDPSDATKRIDLNSMRQLMEKGGFTFRRERDLDLFFLDPQEETEATATILVLDNELTVYRTTVDDAVMRKSPTVKEMVSIRNAIKILKDTDVLVAKKAETVRLVQKRCIDGLDLSFTRQDIEKLAADACTALDNEYTDGIMEGLDLFAELLGYAAAPKPLRFRHCRVIGPLDKSDARNPQFGPPIIVFRRMDDQVLLLQQSLKPLHKADRDVLATYIESGKKDKNAGKDAFRLLSQAVIEMRL